ncbi:microprocessor complex subunit partner of drosha isoform X2 [Arctopsyche grandis]|uniref:microprocessor complex subunit partner of drosha isoform X2 n=1 Tax=Arctopsyche grandis TaxID=121162 RepID=UPI00406D7565
MVSSAPDAVDIDTKPILNNSESGIVSSAFQAAERNSYNSSMQSSTLWQDSDPVNDGLDNLKEFLVLDDINQDSDKDSDNDLDSDYENSEEVPEDELEALLDEPLPDTYKGAPKRRECPYDQRQKLVLEEKGINHFEVLPLGWLMVIHNSGMPLYLHKPSRVCTLSKPYFLGPGSVRKHEVPISAIPCLNYRRALEDEKSQINNIKMNIVKMNVDNCCEMQTDNPKVEKRQNDDDSNPSCAKKLCIENIPSAETSESKGDANEAVEAEKIPARNIVNQDLLKKLVNSDSAEQDKAARAMALMLPNAKVETAQENWKSHHLRHGEVTDYCKKLFKFKIINIMRFKSWSERRKFTKTRKALQRPTLPDGTKLITFPIHTALVTSTQDAENQGALGTLKTVQKECLMNPNGKSYVCILHEYVQRALKKQPTYEFKELENGATPYSATVSINGIRYGVGYGTSKRLAKSAAAKASIEILIPEMREKINNDNELNGTASRTYDQDLAFFDDIMIEDPRVADFCAKTMEPSPHTILQTCLSRNFGAGAKEIKYQMNTLKHQRNEFTIVVGKHTATVVCKNKRDGKQRASQAILQALHPNISSWGSLLRLYGTRSVKSFKEKKQEEQEITLLQSRAAVNQPNYAILEKLRSEMSKLREKDVAINPIGKLLVKDDMPAHSGTNLSIVDL